MGKIREQKDSSLYMDKNKRAKNESKMHQGKEERKIMKRKKK